MKSDYETHIHEALDLVNSERSSLFVSELENSVKEALFKAKAEKSGNIVSASRISDKAKATIDQLIEKILKRKVKLFYSVKPEMLAGFKIQVGDWKLDATLLRQLELLCTSLGGATHE